MKNETNNLLIAHRGLLKGPNAKLENNPFNVIDCLRRGFDVEIDLQFKNGNFYLGHDIPQYKVDLNFLKKNGLWIHAKSSRALVELQKTQCGLNYFWHESDAYTLTSKGFIWVQPGCELLNKSIWVLPELEYPNLKFHIPDFIYGICSDYFADINI